MFIVQLLHPYMITEKTTWAFVSKVVSLLFNMLSTVVIAFLPRSKCLLISWLQSPSAVILEPEKIKSVTFPIVSSSICHEVPIVPPMVAPPLVEPPIVFQLAFVKLFLLYRLRQTTS